MSRQPVRDYSRLAGTAFDQAGVAGLRVMVVGAGALGNEVLKCLALMGTGEIVIVDRDRIERSNLTRSVLYCAPDIEAQIESGAAKAVYAARRVTEINPDVRARAVVGEIADVGLGLLRRVDVVFGCLDNEMARVELGWACVRADRLLVDGGLGNLNPSSGMVLVFPGQDGPCPLCRKSAERRRALLWELQGREDPCWMKERGQQDAGIVPTTPVMASMVGALQVELGVRAAVAQTPDRASGHAYRLNLHPGPALDVRAFDRSPSCPLHDPETFLQEIEERRDRRSESWLVSDLLREAEASSLQLDWPLTVGASCRSCGATWAPLMRRTRFRQVRCPDCGGGDLVETDVVSDVGAESPLAARSLAELGLPAGHVHDLVCVREGSKTHRFVEVTGDLSEAEVTEVQPSESQSSERQPSESGAPC